MASIDTLLDMVYSEAVTGEVEDPCGVPLPYEPKPTTPLPPIRFNLELIRTPDGKYEWVE